MANVEHSANFFLHISSFTRHLLDDILPVEFYQKPNLSSDIIENLIKECDALIGSLHNFKTKTSAIQINEAASLLQGLNIEEDNFQFNKLCELFIEKVITISDLIKYKPFYCKICDLITLEEKVFNEHCSSLKHIEQTNETVERLTVFKCNQCSMVLIAPQPVIIKLLSYHWKVDEHVQKVKENNEKGQRMNMTKTEQILAGSSSDLRKFDNATKSVNTEMNTAQVSGKNKKNNGQRSTISNSQNSLESIGNVTKSVIPPKANQALKLIRKKLRSEKRFPDYVLHYCNICEIIVYSTPCYIQHNSSKQHISAVNNATIPINVFKCDRCKVVITGYQNVIDDIIKSDLHKEIDEWAKTLKIFPVQKQGSAPNITERSTVSVPNITERSTVGAPNITEHSTVCAPNITEHSTLDSMAKANISSQQTSKEIPIALKDSLIYLYEIVKKSNFKKNAIFYCLVCDRSIDSIQNLMQHTTAKKHNLLRSSLTESSRFYQCSVCLIGLFGTANEVSNIINSKEHINLDKKINSFKSIENNLTDSNVSSKEKNDGQLLNITKSTEIKPTVLNNIPTKFFTFNAKLLNGCFIKSGYCRICNKGVIIKNGWALHVNCKKHIAKSLECEANKNLIPLLCKYCQFQIIGDQQYGNACMNAHMKLNHPDCGNIETKNETVNDFKQNSIISTQQYVNSNIKNSNDSLIQNKTDDELKIEDETSTNNDKININSNEKNILNLNIFIKFLKKKKNIFLDEGLKQFGGICLLCSMVFEDYYMWLIHVKGSTHRDENHANIYERECENCNLSLFGERAAIDDELWPLEEHASLDALISQ